MKVIKSEVDEAYNISFIDLAKEIEGISSLVNDFVKESYKELSGESFTEIRKNIDKQNEQLKNYAHFISMFDKYIMRATKSMSSYMYPYSELDDSTKFEVYTLIDGLKRTNDGLRWQINHAKKDSEGKSNINISALEWRIANNIDEIEELDNKYKLLDGLAAEDSKDASIITGYFSKDNLLNKEFF